MLLLLLLRLRLLCTHTTERLETVG
jgi:hypothetical protein